MELIDRYVHEVGRHLPRKNRTDIQAELQSTLVDTLEARVEGEPSLDDEVELLQEFGSPQAVAASYWPEGQYLIGPRLYPLFRMVVGIVLIVFVIVQLVLLGVAVVFNQEILSFLSILDILGEMIGSVFTAFSIIVIVFAILQRFDVRPETDQEWDPRDLPQVEEDDTVSRGGTVAEITISLVIIAVLLFLPDKIGVVVSPGMEVILNQVIISYIPLIILSILLGIALDVILLWRGRWETGTRLAKITTNLFGIYVLYVLIAGHNAWLAQQGVGGFLSFLEALPEGDPMGTESVLIISMHAFRMAFIIALIVTVVDTIKRVYQLLKPLFSPPVTIPLPVEKGK
ncbi:MAG: hypothetical protein KAT29_02505 [Anaerolineales bacterium]|nr:hypothetical protein [Anaerolineales bacterium]